MAGFETEHRVHVGDASGMALAENAVDLVVTSPPYPMIELWDELFCELDPAIRTHLDAGDVEAAYRAMHTTLEGVWAELARVLRPGGIACVVVGDATRSVGDGFRRFPNHATITETLREQGLRALPGVLWRKPTNSKAKFMGSGTLPTNAYVTLEHEHVLVFRNGTTREFAPGDRERYESAFFWEERNRWFSDCWTDIRGASQALAEGTRTRSAAFPIEVALRLIRMYSTYEDLVCDPFWGTGTTSLAALLAGRNSVGYELDGSLLSGFEARLDGIEARSRERAADRLDAHREFVAERRETGNPPEHEAEQYDFPVVTSQEREIRLYTVDSAERVDHGCDTDGGGDHERATEDTDRRYVAEHVPVEP